MVMYLNERTHRQTLSTIQCDISSVLLSKYVSRYAYIWGAIRTPRSLDQQSSVHAAWCGAPTSSISHLYRSLHDSEESTSAVEHVAPCPAGLGCACPSTPSVLGVLIHSIFPRPSADLARAARTLQRFPIVVLLPASRHVAPAAIVKETSSADADKPVRRV